MKDSVTVQKELHDAFAGLSESEQIAAASAIFGKNQMSNWLALINTAPDEVAALNDQLGVTGTTSDMAAAMMEGFGGKLEKLKSSIDVAAVSFGQALAPAIGWVADKIQAAVDWFNNLDPRVQ
jgi:TP901 family phage tail tape measure protein